MYVKIFGTILDSSIWGEDSDTCKLWITMLAMADAEGVVLASVGGLAHRARLGNSATERALSILEGPDPDSRDGTDGRRIERLDGGWQVLNYGRYREIRTVGQMRAAARQQRKRERDKESPNGVTVTEISDTSPQADAEASAQAEAKAKTKNVRAQKPRAPTWLTPYLDVYQQHVGAPANGRLAAAVKPVEDALGAVEALALFRRWCQSDKSAFGVQWFAQHWRQALGGRKQTQQDRNFAAIDRATAELEAEEAAHGNG